jgi:signal transduction histidine kinase
MKLARKLALFLVLGMCLVLTLEAFLGIRRETRLLEGDMRSDEHVTGRALASALTQLWRDEGKDRALRFLDQANEVAGQPYVRWVELDAPPNSPLAARLPPAEIEAVKRGEETSEIRPDEGADGRFFSYIPVRLDGAIVGALELSESLQTEHQYIRALVLRRIGTTAVLAGLSGVLAIMLGAVIVGRPVRHLVQKARRVGAGDLSGPLQLSQKDEIGELAIEINAMCERLAEAQKRLADETAARIAAIEQLRHADRLATVGKLASGVAHELGTPLNVVSQRAKMISTGEVEGERASDGARIIVEQSQRMTAVIRQLLDFARRHSPQKTPNDLRRIAEQTATFLSPLAAKRSIALHVQPCEAPAVAAVDGGQIQQALTNLVVNAIQAMPSGGTLRIEVGRCRAAPPADHAKSEGDYLRVAVCDEGRGIPAEDLPHLFEPFFTTKDVGEGTGLGLAVAYGIVREHEGWIDVDSAPGRGSTFAIFLPERSGA